MNYGQLQLSKYILLCSFLKLVRTLFVHEPKLSPKFVFVLLLQNTSYLQCQTF